MRRKPLNDRSGGRPQTSSEEAPPANLPNVADSDVFWVDVAFFVDKTPARRAVIARIAKALGATLPRGNRTHVLEGGFGSSKRGPHVHVHIDQTKVDAETAYYVLLHMHGENPHVHEHEDGGGGEAKPASWLYEQLVELRKDERRVLGFFDAHLESTEWPAPAQSAGALPVTVAGRVLPVVGVSYGAELAGEGVYAFRWTQRDGTMAVDVSYSGEFDLADLPDLWKREHTTVMSYVKEALPR